MGPDERIKLFKRIAKNYDRYLSHARAIEDKISLTVHKMENVHSIDFEKPSGSGIFSERPMIELIEKKASLEKEKQYYLDLIIWTDDVMQSFDSGAIKALIWMSCIKRRSLSSIAEEYNISRDYLYKVRRVYLLKALTDEIMARLGEIQESATIQAMH